MQALEVVRQETAQAMTSSDGVSSVHGFATRNEIFAD